ncbi:proteoglycan 4-like [Physella acuta]|uniref:proteoglycan 4-like n=1 Tax=Physella acuta TaxID=109671 RepID=UPI0027DAD1FE|nr:proteoglycan 4-like [Physella acuta]
MSLPPPPPTQLADTDESKKDTAIRPQIGVLNRMNLAEKPIPTVLPVKRAVPTPDYVPTERTSSISFKPPSLKKPKPKTPPPEPPAGTLSSALGYISSFFAAKETSTTGPAQREPVKKVSATPQQIDAAIENILSQMTKNPEKKETPPVKPEQHKREARKASTSPQHAKRSRSQVTKNAKTSATRSPSPNLFKDKKVASPLAVVKDFKVVDSSSVKIAESNKMSYRVTSKPREDSNLKKKELRKTANYKLTRSVSGSTISTCSQKIGQTHPPIPPSILPPVIPIPPSLCAPVSHKITSDPEKLEAYQVSQLVPTVLTPTILTENEPVKEEPVSFASRQPRIVLRSEPVVVPADKSNTVTFENKYPPTLHVMVNDQTKVNTYLKPESPKVVKPTSHAVTSENFVETLLPPEETPTFLGPTELDEIEGYFKDSPLIKPSQKKSSTKIPSPKSKETRRPTTNSPPKTTSQTMKPIKESNLNDEPPPINPSPTETGRGNKNFPPKTSQTMKPIKESNLNDEPPPIYPSPTETGRWNKNFPSKTTSQTMKPIKESNLNDEPPPINPSPTETGRPNTNSPPKTTSQTMKPIKESNLNDEIPPKNPSPKETGRWNKNFPPKTTSQTIKPKKESNLPDEPPPKMPPAKDNPAKDNPVKEPSPKEQTQKELSPKDQLPKMPTPKDKSNPETAAQKVSSTAIPKETLWEYFKPKVPTVKPRSMSSHATTGASDRTPSITRSHATTGAKDRTPSITRSHATTGAKDRTPSITRSHATTGAKDRTPSITRSHATTGATDRTPSITRRIETKPVKLSTKPAHKQTVEMPGRSPSWKIDDRPHPNTARGPFERTSFINKPEEKSDNTFKKPIYKPPPADILSRSPTWKTEVKPQPRPNIAENLMTYPPSCLSPTIIYHGTSPSRKPEPFTFSFEAKPPIPLSNTKPNQPQRVASPPKGYTIKSPKPAEVNDKKQRSSPHASASPSNRQIKPAPQKTSSIQRRASPNLSSAQKKNSPRATPAKNKSSPQAKSKPKIPPPSYARPRSVPSTTYQSTSKTAEMDKGRNDKTKPQAPTTPEKDKATLPVAAIIAATAAAAGAQVTEDSSKTQADDSDAKLEKVIQTQESNIEALAKDNTQTMQAPNPQETGQQTPVYQPPPKQALVYPVPKPCKKREKTDTDNVTNEDGKAIPAATSARGENKAAVNEGVTLPNIPAKNKEEDEGFVHYSSNPHSQASAATMFGEFP